MNLLKNYNIIQFDILFKKNIKIENNNNILQHYYENVIKM